MHDLNEHGSSRNQVSILNSTWTHFLQPCPSQSFFFDRQDVITYFLFSSVILGRAIKNEHIALGVFTTAFGGAWLATRGGKSERPTGRVSPQKAKETVPINAGSRSVISSFYVQHLLTLGNQ